MIRSHDVVQRDDCLANLGMRGQQVLAIDTRQQAASCRRSDEFPIFGDHHVVNCTFGHFPTFVEEKRICEPSGTRIVQGSVIQMALGCFVSQEYIGGICSLGGYEERRRTIEGGQRRTGNGYQARL